MNTRSHPVRHFDVLLIGGGLANGVLTAVLRARRPGISIAIIESGERLGGDHTWSFFESDIDAKSRALLDPFVSRSWPAYEVRFPDFRRTLDTGYATIRSERFDASLRAWAAADECTIVRGNVVRIDELSATLDDGDVYFASAVFDGRGPEAMPELELGYQKFVGRILRLRAPHGLTVPIVMDACVPQADGYRFFYCLPFDERTLLIEDTRYADGPELQIDDLRERIAAYAAEHGWEIERIEHEETGILPVALDGDLRTFWNRRKNRALTGLRAALFHPTTGYSIPDAVRIAEKIAAIETLATSAAAAVIRAHSLRTWEQRKFFRLINRMLFRAAAPDSRWRILRHFYRLPQRTIQRFYAGALTTTDCLRVLWGRPPVPVAAAVRCAFTQPRGALR